MNISDELERILGEMDEDEKRKLDESNTAKSMALLAEGGTPKSPPTGDLIHELRAQMYAADPANTQTPQEPDLATQFIHWLSNVYFPGLTADQANVPTAAQGSYSDVPSHASGGSVGYHQPDALEQNMLALGGAKAMPIIMALHKAAGGRIDLPKFDTGGSVDNPSTLGSMGSNNVDVELKLLTPEQAAAMDKQLADQIPTAQPFIKALPETKPESLPSQYDFLTQYGKNMIPNSPFMQLTEMARKPLQELMAGLGEASDTAKIPPVIPELAAFEAAMGPGAQAAMSKGDEALKAITPKYGEFGSNLGNLSYRGSHTAPGPDFGAPLHDLTGGGEMYPADVYGPNAVQYYGTGFPKLDKEVFDLAKRVKGKPDAEVTMYRAVPNDENITDINKGDWVTLSKDYAKIHGEHALDNDYKILSKKAKAKELYTNADSIHEFGYQPEELTPEQRQANFEAFKAASVDPRQYYHGTVHNPNPAFGETVKDMNDLITSGGITQFRVNPRSGMTFVSPDPYFAERYAGIDEFGRPQKSQIFGLQRGAIYPVHVQVKKPFDYENPSQVNDLVKEIGDPSNIINDVWKGGTEKMPEEFKHELTHALISNGDWSFLEHPDAISAAKRLGHDAMYIKEKKTKNLGVFNPNAIKSSIANRGTYDITEPHMSKAQGGLV